MMPPYHALLALPLVAALLPGSVSGQTKAADDKLAAGEFFAGKDPRQRYFFHAAKAKKAPKDGYKLLLVLPGGDGSADFAPFVKRIWKHAAPDDFVVVQLVAHQWNAKQAKQVVWPTASSRKGLKGVKFTTESFIANVVKDVDSRISLNTAHIYALGWSSSGPACYAALLAKDSPLAGAYVAMSVFHAPGARALKRAKGKRVFLLHSPEDWVKIRFAETAKKRLAQRGATTTLLTYAGGHGWHGDVYGNLRKGLDWIVGDRPAAKKNAKRKK